MDYHLFIRFTYIYIYTLYNWFMVSKFVIDNKKSENLIISFGGSAKAFGGILPFEFLNFLDNKFSDYDKHFYIDIHQKWYNKGIDGISNDIESTIAYLRQEIEKYKKVVFLGTSAGGYAAILFGSLLNIQIIIAFAPQSIINGDDLNENYKNLSKIINNTTKYYIYGSLNYNDVNDLHHISHCENIENNSNVVVIRKNNLHMRDMRDSGELFELLKTHLE